MANRLVDEGEATCARCYSTFSTTDPPHRVTEEVHEVSGTYYYDRGHWHASCVEEANA